MSRVQSGTAERGARVRDTVVPSTGRFARRGRGGSHRSWRRLLGVLLLALLVLALVWVVGWSRLLAVRDVEVDGVSKTRAAALEDRAAIRAGTPLARVDTDALARRLGADITLAEVSVERSWPSTIRILAVPRTPAVVLRNPQGLLEVVAADGVAYDSVTRAPKGVPVVTATSSAGTSPEALGAALSVVRALPAALAEQVDSISVSSSDLVTFDLGGVKVIWGGGRDAGRKAAILETLLQTDPKQVDVSAPDTPTTR